jgi:hypothetical protein
MALWRILSQNTPGYYPSNICFSDYLFWNSTALILNSNSAKFKDISCQLPALLLDVCCNQRALVDNSGTVRTQMGTQNKSENGRSAWDSFYDTTV